MSGGAPKGNKNAVKLPTEDLKKEAYQDYCDHIASGKSKEGWRYKDKEKLLCTYKTMENWIKEDPVVFPAINKELSECDSFSVWEAKGMSMMEGEAEAQPALYQMFMRNKFGWDKDTRKERESTDNSTLERLAEFFKAISTKTEKAPEANNNHSD